MHVATWKWTQPRTSKPLNTRGLISLFGLFAGLCAVFALIATLSDAWQEHAHASWPQTFATIERPSVEPYHPFKSAGGGTVWFIRCRIRYLAGTEEVQTSIRSSSTYSERDIELMRQWVARHEAGTPLLVHYDPQNRRLAVLTATDMPYAGPRTPNDLRVFFIFSSACMASLTLARRLRHRERAASDRT